MLIYQLWENVSYTEIILKKMKKAAFTQNQQLDLNSRYIHTMYSLEH